MHSLPIGVLFAVVAIAGCRTQQAQTPSGKVAADRLQIAVSKEATVFDVVELQVSVSGRREPPADEVHDAYDANRDGRFVRLRARFQHDATKRVDVVAGFAMRDEPNGPWHWRIRWSPRRPGTWRVQATYETAAGALRSDEHHINASVDPRLRGPLVAPSRMAPGYLRRLRPDGTSESLWLFGACRAWVVSRKSGSKQTGWAKHSSIERSRELFEPMRAAGFNLLNQWMAPWEYSLVHHDRAEHWRRSDETWRRHALRSTERWQPHRAYDQGRARAFDRLLRATEGDATLPVIYQLLAPLPHQLLQMRSHPWGEQESGWSPDDDGGRQHRSKLNGFSGFRPKMTAWSFFEATPSAPLAGWRSRLFDHQANYFRYLIARWGYSRSLGAWVLIDELDAIGDTLGDLSKQRGWWAHPRASRWLANMVRMFRGKLRRIDGQRYLGDPFNHPLHAATTSSDNRIARGGNLDWDGVASAPPDLLGWHWYPELPDRPTDAAWIRAIDGLVSYSAAPSAPKARLVSEFGLPDRGTPDDKTSLYYPTLYHHAVWASIFSGHAGTAMDWDDGKQFGELRWRDRAGAFDKQRYPIDKTLHIVALRKFLFDLRPDELRRCNKQVTASRGVRVLALCKHAGNAAYGWLFAPRSVVKRRLSFSSFPAGQYRLTWFDPWTGKSIARAKPLTVSNRSFSVDARPAIRQLQRSASAQASYRLRIARGQDLAFKLLPVTSASR